MCVSCKGGLVKKRRKSGKTGIVGQTAEHYPMEDRVLKAAARFMGEELLPLLGGGRSCEESGSHGGSLFGGQGLSGGF